MIVYKIYNIPDFEKNNKEFFSFLLYKIKKYNYLSSSIDEIIVTDNFENEINILAEKNAQKVYITKSRENIVLGKIIRIGSIKKLFFDANYVNASFPKSKNVFLKILLETYSEDLLSKHFQVPEKYYADTPLDKVVEIQFFHWAAKVVSIKLFAQLGEMKESSINDVKTFVNPFKRQIRKLHYDYQSNNDLAKFWINVLNEINYFILNCINVKDDEKSFASSQEFKEVLLPLISEIKNQTKNLIKAGKVNLNNIIEYYYKIINKCFIDVIVEEDKQRIKITDTPKKLFRNNLIDTEPRIVAFIDILGFSNIIKEYETNEQSNILNDLYDTLNFAIKYSFDYLKDIPTHTELTELLEYKMFSDCICVSLPYFNNGYDFYQQFYSIVTIAKTYQLLMMQKGFFVRGGISSGSYYSDKNMIFSGGLVNAYNIEKKAEYPIIAVDNNTLKTLYNYKYKDANYLIFKSSFIIAKNNPDIVFINPFDLLDNAPNYYSNILKGIDNILKQESKELSSTSVLANIEKMAYKQTKDVAKPLLEVIKMTINKDVLNDVKHITLNNIEYQLKKYKTNQLKYKSNTGEYKKIQKIINKLERLALLTKWSIDKKSTDMFINYDIDKHMG